LSSAPRVAISAEQVLADLNPEQREAAQAVIGPVVILAGAGTGKTRVISHRVAYAVATGAVDERQVLVVSFTTKAAREMEGRLRALGLRHAKANTLHAAAFAQLRHFWPQVHDRELPTLIESKIPLVRPLARGLPGNYRFAPTKDLADEIEWAKNRRIQPSAYAARASEADRAPPIPIDLMSRLYADYERAKARTGRLDFEDLLEQAVRLYETDASAAALVRRRYAWFSADEYQDTNPIQQALLDAWVGERQDIGVVGDPNQTIYSFTGATPSYLLEFARRYPAAKTVSLVRNYRSTRQVLALANRLVRRGSGPTLVTSLPDGPEPEVRRHGSEGAELEHLTTGIRSLLAGGTPAREIAVLTRTNYQLEPIAAHLRAAGIPFRFTGVPFFQSPDVRAAIRALGALGDAGSDLAAFVAERWRGLGYDPDAPRDDPDAAERQAAFETLLGIVERVVGERPGAGVADLLAEFERLASVEADGQADGVTLSTIHGAKGAEWDAVFVPMLEEGSLPIRHALKHDAGVDEERRLLYVALTRARRHLALSWSATRTGRRGNTASQRPSRFLAELAPPRSVAARRSGETSARPARATRRGEADPVTERDQDTFTKLAEWRRDRARRDSVPAYVVAHDATLRAIAAARPTNATELSAVPGMGAVKVERYGDEICAVVRRGSGVRGSIPSIGSA
jgi:DNA helicase-2/ATP-dependent DNA helicase PcrA